MVRPVLTTLVWVATLAQAAAVQAGDARSPAYAGDAAKGQEIATTVCVACHGADGNSPAPPNPKLAGQHATYLFKQMKNFKPDADGKAERNNPIMNGMIAAYDEKQMKDMAAYFAVQKPALGETTTPSGTQGKKLWRAGDAGKGLPACAACHGPAGAGLPTQFPRLAGQFADYVDAQLKAFRSGERSNDPNRMMQMIAAKMTDAEIRAVSDYIAGLR